MRIVTQAMMNRIFEITDKIPLSREAIQVPLGLTGDGSVRKLGFKIEIVLPDSDNLDPFFNTLQEKIKSIL